MLCRPPALPAGLSAPGLLCSEAARVSWSEAPGEGWELHSCGQDCDPLAWVGWEGQPQAACRFSPSGFLIGSGEELHSAVDQGLIQLSCLGGDRPGPRTGRSLHLRQADMHSTEFPGQTVPLTCSTDEQAASWGCCLGATGRGLTSRDPSAASCKLLPPSSSPSDAPWSRLADAPVVPRGRAWRGWMLTLGSSFTPGGTTGTEETSCRGAVLAQGRGSPLLTWSVVVSVVQGWALQPLPRILRFSVASCL